MPEIIETLLAAPPGFRGAQVGRFLWQLDEQRRRLTADTRGLTPGALAWQPAPGMNSIGMLLAHIAWAENHLVQVGMEGKATSDTRAVLGIEEDGLPLAPEAPPWPALDGRDLATFDDLLARSRAYTRGVALGLTDGDLEDQVVRTRPDGVRRVFNKGWVLYHLLEHEAGHHAQINLLRHLQRARPGSA
ncbi:MAG: hypothetical protein A2W00_13515 [Candidatus Eisenbacteria bacterium RBG_16_71_46]|nr:MAG: hypothetical protein A2W00_13515 [Candidatus Eisenbacteria bacterium RBG_16_71_46]OGF21817.1 MAG: hypothetical protein A2V63_12615 [Candidatus Eisenbacteria bacterium RBG_19FT_COMBO_70_11]